jgi:hypothetical protein
MSERVVEFGSDCTLTGILNQPEAAGGADRPVLLLLNSGTLHRVGPCRLYVRLARRLAEHHLASLRFDFSGIGDSPPRSDAKAFHDYSVSEVGTAIDYLAQQGFNKFFLLGICSGADTAWYSAIVDKRVSGIVLLDGFAFRNFGFYWHHYRRRIFDLSVWQNFFRNPSAAFSFLAGPPDAADEAVESSEEVVFDRDWPSASEYHKGISQLVDRGATSLYIFTSGAGDYCNHASQLEDSCDAVRESKLVDVIFRPDIDHMISATDAQTDILKSITRWLEQQSGMQP